MDKIDWVACEHARVCLRVCLYVLNIILETGACMFKLLIRKLNARGGHKDMSDILPWCVPLSNSFASIHAQFA